MEEITLLIGSVEQTRSGFVQDNRRPVRFIGEQLARRTEYGFDSWRGTLTDTRGVTETLYRTEAGRLVVYVEDWSRWVGEPSTYSLVQITEADLQPGGRYEMLGLAAGLSRPLTLDEALAEAGE